MRLGYGQHLYLPASRLTLTTRALRRYTYGYRPRIRPHHPEGIRPRAYEKDLAAIDTPSIYLHARQTAQDVQRGVALAGHGIAQQHRRCGYALNRYRQANRRPRPTGVFCGDAQRKGARVLSGHQRCGASRCDIDMGNRISRPPILTSARHRSKRKTSG